MSSILATIIAAAYALLLLLSYRFRNSPYTIWILIGLSMVVKIYLSTISDILNMWDEQFHALVAKNMTTDPFNPKLYPEAVADYHYWDWARNHIWLHKPPLFLWFIALSIKIFGLNAFAVRLPSIVLSTLTMVLVAKLARDLKNNEASWWTTVLLSFNPFLPLLVTGVMPTDHNDVVFIFFVTLSYYLFIRYRQQKHITNALLLGLSVSACILNKWLLGLWVFIPMGVYWIQRKFDLNILKHILLALATSLVLPAVWYLYIHLKYPVESSFEFAYNARHFYEPLEGHRGSITYYLQMMPQYYGIVGMLIILLGLISMLGRSIDTFAGVIFVYLFFSIAATKMPAFTFWVAPVMILYGGIFMSSSIKKIRNVNIKATVVAGLLGLLAVQMKPADLYKSNAISDIGREKREIRTMLFKEWAANNDTGNIVVTGLPNNSHVIFMFYTGAIGYDYNLSAAEVARIEHTGKKVVDWKTIEQMPSN